MRLISEYDSGARYIRFDVINDYGCVIASTRVGDSEILSQDDPCAYMVGKLRLDLGITDQQLEWVMLHLPKFYSYIPAPAKPADVVGQMEQAVTQEEPSWWWRVWDKIGQALLRSGGLELPKAWVHTMPDICANDGCDDYRTAGTSFCEDCYDEIVK